MKAAMAFAVLAAMALAAGCAKGVRELQEGSAAELRGDWKIAEEKYAAAGVAGNGEGYRKLAELWLVRKAEEVLGREIRDAAWRDEARAVASRIAELGNEAAGRGFPVEGIAEGVARLEMAIEASRAEEERRQEEERRAELAQELDVKIAEAEAKRAKPEQTKKRLEGQMQDLRETIMKCAQDSQKLARRMDDSKDLQQILQVLAFAYDLRCAETGEDPKSEEALKRMVLQGTPGYLEVSQAIDRRLEEAREELESLKAPWNEELAELAECDGALSALHLQRLALDGPSVGGAVP